MKSSMTVLALVLGLGLALPASNEAHAGYGGIQRCRAADGTAVYTDKPCTLFDARPEAMPQELGIRLASEAAREPEAYADAASSDAILPTGVATGRRSLQDGCARTPTQLAMDIQASMGLHDVNRLAESWYWVGMTQKQAMPLMERLEHLTHRQVLSTHYYDAQIGFGLQLASADSGHPDDGRAGILQLEVGGRDGSLPMELNVERYAGCYFARF